MDPESFDLSRLSSYFRELAETSQPVTSSSTFPAELRSLCGPWVSLTAAVAKASFELAGVKTAGSVVDLVVALSGTGDAQTELLKSIKADTQLLRQEPLQTAITLMSEAERVGPNDERWVQFLKDAVASLYKAKSLAASSEEKAIVYFGLGCAYLTLGYSRDARYWIDECVKSRDKALDSLVAWASRRRLRDIQRFLPFSNTVQICAATIQGWSRVDVVVEVKLVRRSMDDLPEKYQPLITPSEYIVTRKSFDLATHK